MILTQMILKLRSAMNSASGIEIRSVIEPGHDHAP